MFMSEGDIEALKKRCLDAVNFLDFDDKKSIFTGNGKAVSVNCCLSQCITDYKRTAYFIAAVEQEIETKGNRILYLGSGPFGFLLLPALLNKSGLKVVFVDVNPSSLLSLMHLCNEWNLTKRHDLRFVLGDACETDRHAGTYDVLLTETMNSFLEDKPFSASSGL